MMPSIYLDIALPFGLRSAPTFSALVDGLLWILHSKGVGPLSPLPG